MNICIIMYLNVTLDIVSFSCLYYNVHTKEEGLILMTVISLRIDSQEDKLIKEYAKAKNISVSALIAG